jgi:threonine dehydrogenase-like Zn-dependent dehydrogenase
MIRPLHELRHGQFTKEPAHSQDLVINQFKANQRYLLMTSLRQVLLRMDSVGICGSDVHYWTHGAIGTVVRCRDVHI